nr:MAG TPA: hypothetical protein [Caudoviricetes sp.]
MSRSPVSPRSPTTIIRSASSPAMTANHGSSPPTSPRSSATVTPPTRRAASWRTRRVLRL